MCDCYYQQRLKEIEHFDYYSVHNDILIVTTKPELIKAKSAHGVIIVAPTVEEVTRLLKQTKGVD